MDDYAMELGQSPAHEFSSLEEAVKSILSEPRKNKISFRQIYNRLCVVYPCLLENAKGEKIFWNDENLFECVLKLEGEFGEIMKYRQYERHVNMENLGILKKEGLAYCLSELPGTMRKLESLESPVTAHLLDPNGRGYVFAIECRNNLYVAKLLQDENETKVAKAASDMQRGPKIYEINKSALFEEFLCNEVEEVDAFEAFSAIGEFLGAVHKEGIVIDHFRILEELRYSTENGRIKARMVDWGTCHYSNDPDDFRHDFEDLRNAIKNEFSEDMREALIAQALESYSDYMSSHTSAPISLSEAS